MLYGYNVTASAYNTDPDPDEMDPDPDEMDPDPDEMDPDETIRRLRERVGNAMATTTQDRPSAQDRRMMSHGGPEDRWDGPGYAGRLVRDTQRVREAQARLVASGALLSGNPSPALAPPPADAVADDDPLDLLPVNGGR
eukprot:1826112-Pyramimonas_sp.AAC.1